MIAKKVYESLDDLDKLKDFGFDDKTTIQFLRTQGKPITLELEYERQSWEDHTDYLFQDLPENVEWHASRHEIEEFDLGRSKYLLFTISGPIDSIIEALISWWYVDKNDVVKFINDAMIT